MKSVHLWKSAFPALLLLLTLLGRPTAAVADVIPPLHTEIRAGASLVSLNPAGSPCANGMYQYCWDGVLDGSEISFDVLADPDPTVSATISVRNTKTITETYSLLVTLPVSPIINADIMSGSISGTLTDRNFTGGATLASAAPDAIYTALINGVSVATLLNHPYSKTILFGSSTVGPASFGTPGVTAPGPGGAVNDIAIALRFTLSPGDSASFTSVFTVEEVPEPASLIALTSLLPLMLRRTRKLAVAA